MAPASRLPEMIPTRKFTFPEVVARVEELLELKAGWFDGEEGVPIDVTCVSFFLQTMSALAARQQPLPYIFPTVAGALRAEWEINGVDLVWEREPDGSHFVNERKLGGPDSWAHRIANHQDPAATAQVLGNVLEAITAGR